MLLSVLFYITVHTQHPNIYMIASLLSFLTAEFI